MKINGIYISVKNLEKSADYYEKALGLGTAVFGESDFGRAAFIDVENVRITLVENGRIPVGMFHFTVVTETVAGRLREMRENGATVITEPTEGVNGTYAVVRDPNGVNIVLMQYPRG